MKSRNLRPFFIYLLFTFQAAKQPLSARRRRAINSRTKKEPPEGGSAEGEFPYALTLKESEIVVITPPSFSSFSPIVFADRHLLCPWHTL